MKVSSKQQLRDDIVTLMEDNNKLQNKIHALNDQIWYLKHESQKLKYSKYISFITGVILAHALPLIYLYLNSRYLK